MRWGSANFPDGQVVTSGGIGRLGLAGRPARVLAAAGAAAGFGALVFLVFGYVHYERLATAQQAATRRAEAANVDLQDALARLRDQVGAANQTLNTTQSRIATLSNEAHRQLAATEQMASSKADRVTELSRALDQAQRELHLAEAQRVTLMARLSKSETDAAGRQARRQEAQAGLDQWQKKVQQLTGDRDRAAAERDQLRARVIELQRKLSMRRQSQSVAEARPQPAAAAPARVAAAVQPVPPRATAVAVPQPAARAAARRAAPEIAVAPGRLEQFERTLASTGVDVARLFKDFGAESGLGGPFVPVPRGGLPASHFSAAKLAALPGLLKSLPLSAPMRDYRETSAFGERTDPFNGRPAFHPGIDLAAPYNTPVYATAAGVVTFAGWSGGYGKIVEINHGHGIVTRYGHLARFTALVGEHVHAGSQIGYEGSTGRSTGPHVIYEIDVNGEPQDPAKFFRLAHFVPLAAR